MKARGVPLILLLAVSVFVAFIPFSPVSHAASPLVQTKDVRCQNPCSTNGPTFNSNVASGHTLVVAYSFAETSTTVISAPTITDSQSLTWTCVAGSGAFKSSDNIYSADGVCYSAANSAGSETITVTFTTACVDNQPCFEVLLAELGDSIGFGSSQQGSCTTGVTCSTTVALGTALSYASGDVILMAGNGRQTLNAGNTGPASPWASACGTNTVDVCVNDGTPGSTATTTASFTIGSANNWLVVAADFAPSVVVGTVIPCTFYQLQCWWYPFFFFGVYLSLMVVTARKAEVPEKDYTGHFLEALSIASLLAVIMGMLNIMVPLVMTIVQIVRAIRE